ncbi:Delay of germination 1 [Rhynchospora pubera]|uniref:Delay of germination 1 n=1 Tax=Rhynchospora pubera TaxID=906938 RepID=A0AAV8ERF1_9POAL|nr:Delay of germination 1 [Rhynchospora pubera]
MNRRFVSCYESWLEGQKSDLADLLRISGTPGASQMQLRLITDQCLQNYASYMEQRRSLAREDGPTYFCPPWCTSFENSVLWMGGCRPSLIIRLLYSLTGYEMEAHLDEYLQGLRTATNVGLMALSARQLQQVHDLHQRTLRAEDRLTSRLATLHEDVADKPLLPIVKERQRTDAASTSSAAVAVAASSAASSLQNFGDGHSGFAAGGNGDAAAALQTYADGQSNLVEQADALRMSTVRALATEILNPSQAVEMLIAAKQLHLSVHTWSLERDRQHGRE